MSNTWSISQFFSGYGKDPKSPVSYGEGLKKMGRFNSPVDLSSPQLEAQSLFHTHHSSSLDNKFSRIIHLAMKFAQDICNSFIPKTDYRCTY